MVMPFTKDPLSTVKAEGESLGDPVKLIVAIAPATARFVMRIGVGVVADLPIR